MSIKKIIYEIANDKDNEKYTKEGIMPLFSANKKAKVLIIGQAPGVRAEKSRMFFKDKSGDNLRAWLGVSEEEFYSELFSVVPMDFYYPGSNKNGDKPPRKNFAKKWHKKVLALMPNIKLIILVGKYAQDYYLKDTKKENLTKTVYAYSEYLPKYFPIVHPSPLNFRWHKKNSWFIEKVIPHLKEEVRKIIDES